MARRKTKALRRARLDQPGALAAFSPAALPFLVYGFLTWFAYLLFAMYGNFPVEGEPIDPDFAWAETIRWLGHGGAFFMVALCVDLATSVKRRSSLPGGRLPVSALALVTSSLLTYGLYFFAETLVDWPHRRSVYTFVYDAAEGLWTYHPE